MAVSAVGVTTAVLLATLVDTPLTRTLSGYCDDLGSALALGLTTIMLIGRRTPSSDSGREKERAWLALAAVACFWAVAGLASLWVSTGDAVGRSLLTLTAGDVEAALHVITPAQVALGQVVAAVVVTGIAVDTYRGGQGWSPWTVWTTALVTTAVGGLGGHSGSGPAAVVAAVHLVAAALWFGPLAAAIVVVRGDRAWARFLATHTRVAFWCAVVTAASGITLAVLRLDTPRSLVDDDYGRLLVVKAAVLLVVVLAARRLRRVWVGPSQTGGGGPDELSVRRAAGHSLLVITATAAAAVLSGTPPPA